MNLEKLNIVFFSHSIYVSQIFVEVMSKDGTEHILWIIISTIPYQWNLKFKASGGHQIPYLKLVIYI